MTPAIDDDVAFYRNDTACSGIVIGLDGAYVTVAEHSGARNHIHTDSIVYIAPFGSKRHDGQPYDVRITPSMHEWLCKGGVDPERVLTMGVELGWLLHLWNVRTNQKTCP